MIRKIKDTKEFEVAFLDRFYVFSGDVLIKLGSALKNRSNIAPQPYEPAINEGC